MATQERDERDEDRYCRHFVHPDRLNQVDREATVMKTVTAWMNMSIHSHSYKKMEMENN